MTHEKVQLGMNACGVECCPHAAYKRLVAVASYLHVPVDDADADGGGGMESRVGQLYLYNLNKKQPTREKRRGQLYLYNLAPTASKRRTSKMLSTFPIARADPARPPRSTDRRTRTRRKARRTPSTACTTATAASP